MRCLFLAASVLLSCAWAASGIFLAKQSVRAKPEQSRSVAADHDLSKVQKIEHALEALTKQAFAPNGTQDLLRFLHKAEGELRQTNSTAKARVAVMNSVNSAMAAFQAKLVQRQRQLKKSAVADSEDRTRSMKPLVKKLQARLDRINSLEKDARARAKASEEQGAKLKHTSSRSHDKDDTKTQKLLKYFAKKNRRELKKNLVAWSLERKALSDAIRSAKTGDAEGTKKAMERVVHAEKGDQDFLY